MWRWQWKLRQHRNSANAGVTAFLAGKAATGVHGVAAQSNDVPDGMGASFVGWR